MSVIKPVLNEAILIARLMDLFLSLPEVEAKIDRNAVIDSSDDRRRNTRINLHVAGKSLILQIAIKKAVFPRDVRQFAWGMRDTHYGSPTARKSQPISLIIAESISPGAKALLQSAGIGYYDSGGSLFLPAPGAYLYIDRPAPKAAVKAATSFFSGRRARVLHALLMHHQTWFSVMQLAQMALVSPATVSLVLTEMERFDWLMVSGQGPNKKRCLHEPGALLDAWVQHVAASSPPIMGRYYIPDNKTAALAARIGQVFDEHGVQYALSHEVAAQHYAPFLTGVSQVRVRLLSGTNIQTVMDNLNAREVIEGANFAIIKVGTPGDLLFREQVDGLWMASPVQIYLDLMCGEGRSRELAQHFRKERIGF